MEHFTAWVFYKEGLQKQQSKSFLQKSTNKSLRKFKKLLKRSNRQNMTDLRIGNHQNLKQKNLSLKKKMEMNLCHLIMDLQKENHQILVKSHQAEKIKRKQLKMRR